MKILVAYASRHGATRGIAEHIAQTLTQRGLDVTLESVENVGPADRYDGFVIGSAAYLGGWLGEATAFVRRHHELLSGHPVWLFSSGPTGTEPVDAHGRSQLEAAAPKEFAEFGRSIRPRGTRVFFGAYDPDAAPDGLAERFMAGFMRIVPAARQGLPSGDFRDWSDIGAWADGIARELQPAGVAG